jgi:hypothetical protein
MLVEESKGEISEQLELARSLSDHRRGVIRGSEAPQIDHLTGQAVIRPKIDLNHFEEILG